MPSEVLVVGLDRATYSIIKPIVADGRVLTPALDADCLAQHPIQIGTEPARAVNPRQTTNFIADEERELNERQCQLSHVE